MSHARIEEVSDSDSDPSEGDIDDFDDIDIIRRVAPPPQSQSTPNHHLSPSNIPAQWTAPDGTQFKSAEDDSKYKDFQCIYPVYFDKARSRAEGRRIGIKHAVENPLAREIVEACGRLRLETLFEPAKIHPKDWANPGRVKVRVKGANGGLANPMVKNSMWTL